MIEESVSALVSRYGASILSQPPHRPLPHDIDIYAPIQRRKEIESFLLEQGFILSSKPQTTTAQIFFQKSCYFFDIAYSLNYLTQFFPKARLTERCLELCIEDARFNTFLKYVLLRSAGGRGREYVSSNFNLYADNLNDPGLFKNSPFRNKLSPQALSSFAEGGFFSMIRVVKVSHWFSYMSQRLRAKIDRIGNGRLIAVVGPDGSGKSMVVSGLASAFFGIAMYMGDWNFFLQPLYNAMHKLQPPLARMSYPFFYIENWIRYLKARVYIFMGLVVVTDRYPGLNRHLRKNNVWLTLNDAMYRVFPKPDLYLFISAPAQIVHARKQELTVEEISASQENTRARIARSRHVEIENIDADDCLNQALRAVTALYEHRPVEKHE